MNDVKYQQEKMLHYFFKITRGTRRALSVHPRGSHDLDHLEPEGRDVVLDLVDVVLRHALVLCLPLLLGDVPPHQVPHDGLVLEVPLPRLALLPLKCKSFTSE